jgi:alkane 1-monooxygenase
MPALTYAFSLLPGLLGLVSLWLGGAWLLATPLLVFGLVPSLELFMEGTTHNADEQAEASRRADPWFDRLLVATVPLQIAIVLSLLIQVAWGGLGGLEVLGAVATAAMGCGAYGINVAHELGHRRTRRERILAKVLLLTTLYMHFFIEHNRGHHARVATAEDPASSRRGEWLYAFWLRSVTGGWMSAWRLEAARLNRRGQRVLSWHNEMLRYQVIQAVVLGLVLAVFGPLATLAFMGAALAGALQLETVNYIEHYGLSRGRAPDGRYERVRPEHSWNTNLPVGRALLFDLTRHADHHAHPARPYTVLRHFDRALQLPTGYPGMMVLASCPPLFIAVMDRWLVRERSRVVAEAVAA